MKAIIPGEIAANKTQNKNIKSSRLNILNQCTMSCLECIEVCDLCQYFIASKSMSMSKTIIYTITILKCCIDCCRKTNFDSRLKEVNIETTTKMGNGFETGVP